MFTDHRHENYYLKIQKLKQNNWTECNAKSISTSISQHNFWVTDKPTADLLYNLVYKF